METEVTLSPQFAQACDPPLPSTPWTRARLNWATLALVLETLALAVVAIYKG
jgi:hypothetical protein